MGQNNPEKSPLAPSYGRNALPGNIWFNTGSNLGPHPPWVGDRPKKLVNRERPEKLFNTTQRRQRKKVARRTSTLGRDMGGRGLVHEATIQGGGLGGDSSMVFISHQPWKKT